MNIHNTLTDAYTACIESINSREDRIMTFANRIGAAWEHWFQVEYAYHIQKKLDEKKFVIFLEDSDILKNRRFDISICEYTQSYMENKRLGLIEVKVVANWYLPQLYKINDDIEKLKEVLDMDTGMSYKLDYPIKDVYLMLLLVWGKPADNALSWMEQQIQDNQEGIDYRSFVGHVERHLDDVKGIRIERIPLKDYSIKDNQGDTYFSELKVSGYLLRVCG